MSPTENPRADARADLRALLRRIGAIGALFALGAAAHSAWLYDQMLPGSWQVHFAGRLIVNAVMVAVGLLALLAMRIEVRVAWGRRSVAIALVAAVVAASARVVAQVFLGVYQVASPATLPAEFVGGLAVAVATNLMGLRLLSALQRVRHQTRAAADSRMRTQLALNALQHEEIRVRREVAEGLHGSLQQRLVLLTARIDVLADLLTTGPATPADVAGLREIGSALDRVRENDVREMSRMLYPDGLDVGMIPAVRSLLGRLPLAIGTRLVVSDAVRRLDDPALPLLSQGERLLAVRVVEEAVTNALRHGAALNIEVRVSEEKGALRIGVSDNGRGFDVDDGGARSGTARLADRLGLAGGWLEIRSALGAGAVLEASLPVTSQGHRPKRG